MMGLYMNVIPLAQTGRFLTAFFDEGWSYFYKFTIALFQVFKSELLSTEDDCGIISVLKRIFT